MKLKTINDIDILCGKKVVVRADLNVPFKDGKITDDTRIKRFAPTAKLLSDKNAKVIIITHLGRPDGQKNKDFTTKIITETLSKYTDKPVLFVDDVIGDDVKNAINSMNDGDIILTENVRFYKEEEKNDEAFSKQLAELGDIFVDDAFSCSHRAHASTFGITKFLPSFAGLLMQEEVDALNKALTAPKKPNVAIIGGSKVSTKISLLDNISSKVDSIIIGGAMANTFLMAQGYNVGASLVEKDMLDVAKDILKTAEKNNCKIILPVDVVIASDINDTNNVKNIDIKDINNNDKIFDIGKKTIAVIKDVLSKTKTLLWNGPVGVFEVVPFNKGTNEIAKIVASITKNNGAISVAGGGDTVSAINKSGVNEQDFTYISTAGGAFLEWLEGKELPAITPLYK